MRLVLLSLATAAAVAIPAAPAAAGDQRLTARSGGHFERGEHRGDRDHRRRHRRGDTVVIGDLGWNDAWALYNNRTFKPDSYNDWWHDRPDRAYPRWMQSNANCQRLWWSGGGWRC